MYHIFNIVLDSQIPIPELAQLSDSQEVDAFTFSLLEDKFCDDSNINWFHDWFDPNDVIILSAGRNESSYWLRFPQMVDFEINLNQQTITAYGHTCTTDATVRHLLLDQVIPRMLGQQGKLILHAGAVTLANGKTVAFIGQSGWGKSTLVSSFQQQGAKLISDDCLMIEHSKGFVSVIPNYYGIRLFDDSINAIFGQPQDAEDVAHYSSKRRLRIAESGRKQISATIKLDAVFLLSDPEVVRNQDEIKVTKTGGMDAMMTLIAQTFLLDVTDTSMIARQFMNCGKIFDSKVLCFYLDYQRDHSKLYDVKKAVENKLT